MNTANMIRQSNNTKCSMSKPAANSANMSGCPTPIMNLRVKIEKNNDSDLATLGALLDTGAIIDCVEEKFVKKHKLEIITDNQQMIELVSAEGKVIKVLGTTKLTIGAPRGAKTTTIALVCPQLSHQFLL